MKKILALILSAIMLLTSISCITVFAEEGTVAPLESGYYNDIDFNKYPVTYSDKKREELQIDAETEKLIKEDYIASINSNYIINDITVIYYGTVSDDSMLVWAFPNDLGWLDMVVYNVIGKYLYTIGMPEIKLYKNHQFTSILDAYLNGEISDDLLDEIANILCFGEFVTFKSDEIYGDVDGDGQITEPLETVPETTVPAEPVIAESTDPTEPTDSSVTDRILIGDVNDDGQITVEDATLIQKAIISLVTFDKSTAVVADVNKDGITDVQDATLIQKYIVKLNYNTGRIGTKVQAD